MLFFSSLTLGFLTVSHHLLFSDEFFFWGGCFFVLFFFPKNDLDQDQKSKENKRPVNGEKKIEKAKKMKGG